MYTIEVKIQNNNGQEFGYGKYVNAFVTWDDAPEASLIYASERLPYSASDADISKAKRRVRAKAHRRAKRDYMG